MVERRYQLSNQFFPPFPLLVKVKVVNCFIGKPKVDQEYALIRLRISVPNLKVNC